MCRIRDDVRCEVYPEVEVDDDFGVCLGPGVVAATSVAVIVIPMMVGIDDAGSGFFVGSTYAEVICGRGS